MDFILKLITDTAQTLSCLFLYAEIDFKTCQFPCQLNNRCKSVPFLLKSIAANDFRWCLI